MIPFVKRLDLSAEEIAALAAYQDIGNPQNQWGCCIKEGEEHHDCFVINSALRNSRFREGLSEEDRKRFWELVGLLDDAIGKSVLDEEVVVVRGLTDPGWIAQYDVDSVYVDDAYGSFSKNLAVAARYAGVNEAGEKVFVSRLLQKGEPAIYMGMREEEILVARGARYQIKRIQIYDAGILIDGYRARIYFLSRR